VPATSSLRTGSWTIAAFPGGMRLDGWFTRPRRLS
jgi:hypothetical protein